MNQHIELASVDDARNAQAKEAVRQRISWPVNLTPANVTYHSRGHALLLGSERDTRQAARALQGQGLASLTLLFTAPNAPQADAAHSDSDLLAATEALTTQALTRAQVEKLRISGYLGAFNVTLDGSADEGEAPLNLARALIERDTFDLTLDLNAAPCLPVDLPPPGYAVVDWQQTEARSDALTQFADLVGEFDKPRYFQVNSDLCAHSSSGNIGCTRCLEVCPADAISSHQGRIESQIEIDPFLCQGVGSCTSACPTGAIEFRLPETRRQQETLSTWLSAYRDAGGTAPVLRFVTYDTLEAEQQAGVGSAGHVLDVPLEELGAAGHDQWLTGLAAGASEIRLQYHANMPARLTAFLDQQIAQARMLLEALGHDADRIQSLAEGDTQALSALPKRLPLTEAPLTFSANEKRARFNQVLDRLSTLGAPSGERHRMPSGSAYGAINVDSNACTLCMACVSNCPTPALKAGSDQPALSFLEADCVQCGLCEAACPEEAITLTPGFLAAPERTERHICHEEAAFACIACGKPFATASTVATIKAKLANHPYFAGDAMARLEMCEDCRVKDVWQTMARDPNAQLKV
ncbi:4Fe-4S dicluster domain-containing protein [Halomonas alkaliantarctica]|nr:4Fe-4S dicluster domain-containing protein [Halomonas alkaliantarctica]